MGEKKGREREEESEREEQERLRAKETTNKKGKIENKTDGTKLSKADESESQQKESNEEKENMDRLTDAVESDGPELLDLDLSPVRSRPASPAISPLDEDSYDSLDEYADQILERASWENGEIINPFTFLILDGDNVRKCLAKIMPWVLKLGFSEKRASRIHGAILIVSKSQRMLSNCRNA